MAEVIPDDVMKDILFQLPLKDLVCFHCVSKDFDRVITSEDNRRREKHPTSMIGLFLQHNLASPSEYIETEKNVDLDVISDMLKGLLVPSRLRDLHIADSIHMEDICNGLVLCRLKKRRTSRYAVHNPATGKWDMIPRTVKAISRGMLQYDPSRSRHYRVLCLSLMKLKWMARYRIRIFSSETRNWVDGENINLHTIACNYSSVFLSGISYMVSAWPAENRMHAINRNGQLLPLIRLPEPHFVAYNNRLQRQHIGLSRNCLHLAMLTEPDGLRVWSLTNPYESEWGVEAVITLQDLSNELPPGCESSPSDLARGIEIQAFHLDLDVIFLKLVMIEKIVSYQWSTHDMREVYTLRRSGKSVCYPYSPSYRTEIVSEDNPRQVV